MSRKTPPRGQRAPTERSQLRIADIVAELVAEAEQARPDVRMLQYHASRIFDLGQEVASIQLRQVAAERDFARAQVSRLEAETAQLEHSIEALRLRAKDS